MSPEAVSRLPVRRAEARDPLEGHPTSRQTQTKCAPGPASPGRAQKCLQPPGAPGERHRAQGSRVGRRRSGSTCSRLIPNFMQPRPRKQLLWSTARGVQRPETAEAGPDVRARRAFLLRPAKPPAQPAHGRRRVHSCCPWRQNPDLSGTPAPSIKKTPFAAAITAGRDSGQQGVQRSGRGAVPSRGGSPPAERPPMPRPPPRPFPPSLRPSKKHDRFYKR